MSQCSRPGCANEVPARNKKYCSRECGFDRKTPKVPETQVVPGNKFEQIPPDVTRYFMDRFGEKGEVILSVMDRMIFETGERVTLPAMSGKSWGDWDIGIPFSGKDYRPVDALDYDKIEWMEEIGICSFIKYMKLAPTMAPFRDENGWALASPDKPLAEAMTAQLREVLPRFAIDFGDTSMAYGHAPFEQTWSRKTKYELGLSNSKAAATEFIVPDLPRSINPRKIKHIDRNKQNGSFEGFTIEQRGHPQGLPLERREALILTYGEKFRNLYGRSFYTNLYALAAWYEVAMRSMLRYIDRMAEPVVVGEGPFDLDVSIPVNGTMQKMTGLEAALLAAVQVSFSNAIVIPSNKDPESGERYFNIRYLEAKGDLSVFVQGLEHLEQDMLRAGNAADRALTQSSGGVGSYNIGEIHQGFTLTHSDMILTNWVWGMNTHWIPYASEYNRGLNGPPIILMVQMLDPRRRLSFEKMLLASSGMPSFKDASYGVDWDSFFKTNSVPTLSKADKKAIYDDIQQKAQDMIEANQARGESQIEKTNGQVKQVQEKLSNGRAPLFLSQTEWDALQKRVVIKEN